METKVGLTPLQKSIVEEYELDLKDPVDLKFFIKMNQIGVEAELKTVHVEQGHVAPVETLARSGELPVKALR